jgi:hypothetical protein
MLPQIPCCFPRNAPQAIQGGRARKKKACFVEGEKLPQFGADNAKIIPLTQRHRRSGGGFLGDSTNAAQLILVQREKRQK